MDQVTISRELLRQVLDVLENSETTVPYEGFGSLHRKAERNHKAAITSLRAALEQPVVEPYGWHVTGCNELLQGEYAQSDAELAAKRCGGTAKAVPVYTAPQAKQPTNPPSMRDRKPAFIMMKLRSGPSGFIDVTQEYGN